VGFCESSIIMFFSCYRDTGLASAAEPSFGRGSQLMA
jgi:hypothetical protein